MSDVQIAVIDQQDTQIVLAVPGVQGATGSSIPSGGTTDQVLRKNSSTDYDANWAQVTSAMIANGTIVNDDINNSAAIAGTKISPDFGGQAVTTTGQVSAARVNVTNNTPPSNGIYLPSANNVAISTGGSGRLFVDASGAVTVPTRFIIGTANNVGGLSETTRTTAGVFNTSRLLDGGTNPYLQTGAEAGIVYFNADGSSVPPIVFRTGGGERLRITSAGLVGVGTSSPGNLLHVSGTSSTPATFERTGTTGTFVAFKDSTSLTFIGNTNGTFSIQTPGSSYSDKLVVTSAGNVGIGTSSPATILDIDTQGGMARVGGASGNNLIQAYTGAVGLGMWAGGSPRFYSTGNMTFSVNATIGTTSPTGHTDALTITSTGRVGIGTTDPAATLHLESSAGTQLRIKAGSTNDAQIDLIPGGQTNPFYIYCNSSRNLIFQDNATERARIDDSGRLLVGTSSSRSDLVGLSPQIQLEGATQSATSLSLTRNEATSAGPALLLAKSRGTTAGAATVVQSGDTLGGVYFMGADGTNIEIGAQITGEVDATPGNNDLPSRLVFSTTSDGQASPTPRLTITSTGQVRLAGAGITFNGDTATANELDDYEEGTWTPAITGSTTAGTVGYDNQVGKYTKIGRQVTVSCNCDTAIVTTAPTGDIRVSGLPFTPSASSEFVGAADLNGIPFPSSTTYVVVEGIGGQTYVQFYACGTNVATSLVQANSLVTDDYIRFTLTYFV